MKPGLPDDVKRHVKRKVLKRVAILTVLEFVLAAILIVWGKQILHAGSWQAFDAICCIVILAIPFLVCGVPIKLIDKSWYGVVEKVDVDTTYDCDQPYKPSLERFYLKNTVYLTVKVPDKDKLIIKKVYSGKAKQQRHINTYQKGDKVFHLYGTRQTIVLPDPSKTHLQCAVCGTMNEIPENAGSEKKTCRECHLTLIRDIDLI